MSYIICKRSGKGRIKSSGPVAGTEALTVRSSAPSGQASEATYLTHRGWIETRQGRKRERDRQRMSAFNAKRAKIVAKEMDDHCTAICRTDRSLI